MAIAGNVAIVPSEHSQGKDKNNHSKDLKLYLAYGSMKTAIHLKHI
jgi:hypothetical protein